MFKFKTYLPGAQTWLNARQMTSNEYLNVVKTMQNDDPEQIKSIFITLIENCFEITNTDQYYQIDLFCMLLNLRIMSVSQKLTLLYNPTGDNTGKNVQIELYDLLDKVTNNAVEHQKKYTTGDIEVCVTTPKGIVITPPEVSYIQYIDTIRHVPTDTVYNFLEISPIEKSSIIKHMPVQLIQRLIKSVKHNVESFNVQLIGDLGAEKADIGLSLYDNSIFNTLRLCYNSNMSDLYNLRYILTKRCNIDINYIESIPPIELDTYFSIFKKEIEDERKAMEKQSGKSQNIALPAQNFVQ